MGELLGRNFGLIVAYLIPGFVVLLGLGDRSATVHTWLIASGQEATIGDFLYALLASLSAGMVISALRWASIDQIHRATGLVPPLWRFSELSDKLEAFQFLLESHYRYYQFYANTLVALLVNLAVHHADLAERFGPGPWPSIGFAGIAAVLFAASRDSLKKYFSRGALLLGTESELPMTNGAHHEQEAGSERDRDNPRPSQPSSRQKDNKSSPSQSEKSDLRHKKDRKD